MIANIHYGYGSKHKTPKFTYTGNYKVRDDGVVELLTSGTIVFLEPKVIDLFMVGGGAGGGHRVAAKNQRRGVELSRQRGGGRRRGRQPDPERRPSPARARGFTRHDRREADGDGLSARVYRRGIRWA